MLKLKEEAKKGTVLCSIKKRQYRNASLSWALVILIIASLAIGSYTVVEMYKTYTDNKKFEMALEYAKENNCMAEFRATNGGSCSFNIKAGNVNAGLELMQGSAFSIKLYPRNYRPEYYQVAPNAPRIELNSIPEELVTS